MDSSSSKSPIIKTLIFPWLAHGHVAPFINLSHKLAFTNRFQIHFCSTPTILAPLINHHRTQLFHFIQLPDLPPHLQTTTDLPPHLIPSLIQALQLSKPHFTTILHNLAPDLLIYDAFHPWAPKLAASMGIPAVFFSTSSAAALSFYHHLADSHKGSSEDFPFPEMYLKGYQIRDLAVQAENIVVDDDDDDDDPGFAFGTFKLSHGIVLIKTCREVEQKYMEYLSKLCRKTLIPVGPLLAHATETTEGNNNLEVVRWLDGKERSSVVYISFGSENYLSDDQMVEVAKGLELSNVGFIWVVRAPSQVPEGFAERTSERGLILRGWAPQAAILAHPIVGGFMSHCGWSSVMESMYFGVPILAVPLKFDQPLNCRLAVEIGVGIEVGRDEDGKFDGEMVAKAINEVMVERREEMRGRVRTMSEKVRAGDRDDEFCEAVEQLSRIVQKK